METLLKFYPKKIAMSKNNFIWIVSFVVGALVLFSCQPQESFYKKEFSKEEKMELADKLISGLRYYYQGSVGEQFLLEEVAKHNDEHPEYWRERGIPYLKRGIASGYMPNYEKCVFYDSLGWQGWRGYCTLYFYRDYERALKDLDELDIRTPNFVDHPQATSIDYMRGVCYLQMEQPQRAFEYFDKHLKSEERDVGFKYVNSVNFVLKGITQKKLNQLEEAQKTFELGIKYNEQNADLEYQLAKVLYEKGEYQNALKWLEKAKTSFSEGYYNYRSYVEEFYQVYLLDIEELEEMVKLSI